MGDLLQLFKTTYEMIPLRMFHFRVATTGRLVDWKENKLAAI